ncbi:MAG: uracil phosphoribosyltransferase [Cyanobacteria bacterium SIG31]|nr:uracil phosphoribosyltransferase [Cyanobacteria bacterium SIG31]
MENKYNNLKVITNPIVNQSLCTLRSKNTDTQGVRLAARKLTRILLYEATKNLPQTDITVETPLTNFVTQTINPSITIIISPILRAGLIFTDEAVDILPQATIRHIGMYRDEKTLKPVWYYNKVPMPVDKPEDYYVYITDPMLATGNSLIEAIRLYVDKGIPESNICCVCMISSPQGIENVFRNFPNIKLIVAAVDSHLNERGYIVPGMGDAGDRIYNT